MAISEPEKKPLAMINKKMMRGLEPKFTSHVGLLTRLL